MQSKLQNIPKKIFLQVGPDVPDGIDFNELELQEVCWCQDRQYNSDIAYVLADLSRDDYATYLFEENQSLSKVVFSQHEENRKQFVKIKEQEKQIAELSQDELAVINKDLLEENERLKKQRLQSFVYQSNSMELDDIEKIKSIAAKEASLINQMFSISEKLGIESMRSATDSFTDFLRSTHGLFTPALSIVYRTFVVDLLLAIDEKYRDKATADMLIRGINISNEEMQ